MKTLEKFQEVAKIKFVKHDGDIEIGTLQTADGYELYYITGDIHLNFENEVYYYQPDFDTIMNVIDENRFNDGELTVACFDIEDYFDEYDMLNWLEGEMDEESFEIFSYDGP
tara:strand:- start:198 stop:533 length:336 start_codon:yes stop_codon:yes gene_type:complete